ncbi:MAG: TAXI family TRAP transporter solute-binding subunit [Planctomycetota bacterium]
MTQQSIVRSILAAGLATICTFSILATGCTPSDGGDNAGTGSTGRKFLTLGTAPAGGAFYTVGNAISTTVDGNKGDLNWVLKTSVTKGTQENIRKLDSGEIEFGMGNAAIAYFATKGEGKWKRPYDVRVITTIAPNVGVFVTTAGSGIKTIADLKGKRVVLGPAGAGFEYFLEPLLEAHGVKYDDMTVLSGNYNTANDMLADGKADAAFMGGAIPIPAVAALCQTQDVVFVKMDEAVLEQLKDLPFYFGVPVPADAYSDLNEELFGINVGNMQLLTHAKVDEDTVYKFTKIMYENREKIAEMHPAGKAINPKNAIRNTGTPFHDGAIKFYKEIDIWPED